MTYKNQQAELIDMYEYLLGSSLLLSRHKILLSTTYKKYKNIVTMTPASSGNRKVNTQLEKFK